MRPKKNLREYYSWEAMKNRCSNPRSPKFLDYGGRGIKVCDRWMFSFENFLEDMGERKEGLTLDRINNDGNYEPGNCRWATKKEQQRNKRTNKLTEDDVKHIRLAPEIVSQTMLAELYGVTQWHIGRIINNIQWEGV